MAGLPLFPNVLAEEPASTRSRRGAWERLSDPGDKCSARWLHRASGWMVAHCGHPTANYGFAAIDPDRPGLITASASGLGWPTSKAAIAEVEALLAGERQLYVDPLPTKHGRRQVIAAAWPPWLDRR